jgi:hypothetical protein
MDEASAGTAQALAFMSYAVPCLWGNIPALSACASLPQSKVRWATQTFRRTFSEGDSSSDRGRSWRSKDFTTT